MCEEDPEILICLWAEHLGKAHDSDVPKKNTWNFQTPGVQAGERFLPFLTNQETCIYPMPSSVKVVLEAGKDLEIAILCQTIDSPSQDF